MIVDDHAIVRHGLSMLLAPHRDMTLCAESGSIEEALAKIVETKPDIAIVDITLKEENGLDLVREARKKYPSLKFLILSMHDEKDYAVKALRAGAAGYVMKEKADDVIVQAIRTIMEGKLYLSPDVSSQLLQQMAEGEKKQPETGVESLTERELEVFECIGQGLSTRKIAEKLGLSERTVEVHRTHIKKKLGCEDAAQVFREAVKWVEQHR